MKILIISDSHSKNDWLQLKKDFDLIVHAGDHQMSNEWMIKNTDYFVDGNNDWGGKNLEIFYVENFKFCLIHGDEHSIKNKTNWSDTLLVLAKQHDVNFLIYGHTHVPSIKKIDNIFFINPGSISKPRFPSNTKTYCSLEIDKDKIIDIQIKNSNF